ncbi:DUF4862 family protein [Microbacterium esteraromaticum]|uniref:DUF4862 family protein n=1 Tax=Microbacterium esteraromaticum TaxID=57043 RepID=UPI003C2FA244
MPRPVVVSAYPLSPAFANWDPAVEADVLHGLAGLPGVTALEVPWIDGIHPHDSAWFLANAPDVALAVTPLPFVMRRLATPGYGIASPDGDGRRAAIADLRRVAADVAQITERSAAHVAVVELHTAPRGEADADALARSLAELGEFDWSGARLMIEHCDAHVPGQTPEKGFLSLPDEISAIRASGADVGLWMNWGRSAIELRAPDAVAAQIAAAADSGLLDALVLSGASDRDGPYGGPWIDAHHPFSSLDPEAESLLTDDRVHAAVHAADDAAWLGLKVSRHPGVTTAAEVLRVAERHLQVLAAAAP